MNDCPLSVFVDTSAIFAHFDAMDANHEVAVGLWEGLIGGRTELITSNYVLVETATLLQRRLGIPWVEAMESYLIPELTVVWVQPELHQRAMSALLSANRRELSLVDCVSFEIMRSRGVVHAFAFDRHFAERGYDLPLVAR
jgi:uncharacterized protein